MGTRATDPSSALVEALAQRLWFYALGASDAYDGEADTVQIDASVTHLTGCTVEQEAYASAAALFPALLRLDFGVVARGSTISLTRAGLVPFALSAATRLLGPSTTWLLEDCARRYWDEAADLTSELCAAEPGDEVELLLPRLRDVLALGIAVNLANPLLELAIRVAERSVPAFTPPAFDPPVYSSLLHFQQAKTWLVEGSADTSQELEVFCRDVGFLGDDVGGTSKWHDPAWVGTTLGRFPPEPRQGDSPDDGEDLLEPLRLARERLSQLPLTLEPVQRLADLLALHEELRHYWQARLLNEVHRKSSCDGPLRVLGRVSLPRQVATAGPWRRSASPAHRGRVTGTTGDREAVLAGRASILVVDQGAPADVEAALLATGIVIERGGHFSHLATVARALSVPCLVSAGSDVPLEVPVLLDAVTGELSSRATPGSDPADSVPGRESRATGVRARTARSCVTDLGRAISVGDHSTARKLVVELTVGRDDVEHVTWHPLGFFRKELGEDCEGSRLLLHCWPEGSRRTQEPTLLVHCHVWPLRSMILSGALTDDQWRCTGSGVLSGALYEASNEGPVSVLTRTGRTVSLAHRRTSKVEMGGRYAVAAGVFHRTTVDVGSHCISVARIGRRVRERSEVVGPLDGDARFEYAQTGVDPGVVRSELSRLKAAT